MPRPPSPSGPRGRSTGTSRSAGAARSAGGSHADRRSSGGRTGSSAAKPYQGRSGDSGVGKGRGSDDRRPRRDADDRGPRRDTDDRGPRRDADDRGPRRDTDDRRPRRSADDRRPRRDSDDRRSRRDADDRGPRTEADRRRAAVRARGGGTARQEDGKIRTSAPPERFAEQWIDEGPTNPRPGGEDVRRIAQRAVKRAAKADETLDSATRLDVERLVPAKRQAVLSARLQNAQNSLERERFSEAKRLARSLVKEMGGVAAVHEVIGLASYRMGQWRDATVALELARSIRPRVEDLPVLADCYRAQRRWQDVDDTWSELKQYSPAQEILSEGRIVYAGSLADRGDLYGAIAVMMRSATAPRRVRDHHLRQWYVLADLYDRAGNVQKAREFFKRVASIDPDFADVETRLHQL